MGPSDPRTSRVWGHRGISFPTSVATVTPNPSQTPPERRRAMSRGGGDCPNGMPSPTVPCPGVLRRWRAPPAPCAELGAPTPSPLRCLLHGTPAAVPETAAPSRHPDFGAPGLLTASQTCLGPGPGARTAPGKALTLHRAREGLALAARVHGRRLGVPRPAGVPGCGGCWSTWCKDFSLYFSTPPQPSFSQLCSQGGRM